MKTNLDLLKEKRDDSQVKFVVYKKRIKRYFNSKVCTKNFKIWDLVLKKVFVANREMSPSSLDLKWEGPYTIIDFVGSGTYKLTGEDDKPIKHS